MSEAAEKLEMAQPSLSLGIKKLETEFNSTLFIRSKSGIKLSPQGKQLLPEARETLKGLQRLMGNKAVQKFKIGCHPSVGMFILGDFFKNIHQLRPDLDFEIINSSSLDINRQVASGDIDFGIVMNPVKFQDLIERKIGEDEVCVWEAKDRYQDKLIYNPSMLQSLSILSRWKGQPSQSILVKNLELLSHLVDSGAGLGILPTQVVKAQRLNLKKVPNTPTFKDHLSLVCFPQMINSEEGKVVFEALKKSFKR